jgi:predicted DNA-binding ribbon-helix-helix protein
MTDALREYDYSHEAVARSFIRWLLSLVWLPSQSCKDNLMLNNEALSESRLTLTEEGDKSPFHKALVSRNVVIAGHRTSMRLEPEMWDGLREICRRERSNLHRICTLVSSQKPDESALTAQVRVFVMRYYRNAATEEGHRKVNHGIDLGLSLDTNISLNYGNRTVAMLTKTAFA